MLNIFRVGRVVRIICIFRILRAFRSTKNLLNYLLRGNKTISFAGVACISFMLGSSVAHTQAGCSTAVRPAA